MNILFAIAIHLSVGTFVYGNDIVTTQNTCSKYANIALLVLHITLFQCCCCLPFYCCCCLFGWLFISFRYCPLLEPYTYSMCCRVYVNSAKRFNYSRFRAVNISLAATKCTTNRTSWAQVHYDRTFGRFTLLSLVVFVAAGVLLSLVFFLVCVYIITWTENSLNFRLFVVF